MKAITTTTPSIIYLRTHSEYFVMIFKFLNPCIITVKRLKMFEILGSITPENIHVYTINALVVSNG